jgi:NDP-sugar pyrophosphorylase family protein
MIVIPMAGLSNRFFAAGYDIPKYMLPIGGETVFAKSVRSFEKYFDTDEFLFILRDTHQSIPFVQGEIAKLGLRRAHLHVLANATGGQAETVHLAIAKRTDSFPLFIFNIDTFRHNYEKPSFLNDCDGYLEVFRGEGEHWSFVEPADEINVARTTEKERISNLCSDGLYYFKNSQQFNEIFLQAKSANKTSKGEYYIAPLYNALLSQGEKIFYQLIEHKDIEFCGTPEEYESINKNRPQGE